jgi:hypothetical protein
MRMYVAAAMLSAQVAVAAPAPPPAAPQQAPVVPENWAAAPPPEKAVIQRAIKESFEEEKALAEARSKEAAIPQRYFASSEPERDKYQKFETTFEDAKVPGCLKSDGLKRQSTFIFGGLLALPFIAVAAVRGKCN